MSKPLFNQVNYTLGSLVEALALGQIALPDLQRPFVWKNAKVRDLFDSMYRGYPVGYLLFWQNAFAPDSRAIGNDQKQKSPNLLIVDGQQRLTSLYAVVRGVPVLRSDFTTEPISIAFSPLEERFEVADAAIRKDPSFIPSISEIWGPRSDIFTLVDNYLERLGTSRELSDDERQKVKQAITKLHALTSFPLTALELSATLEDEEVAEVFVRINSKGTPLNQADFILTLMSVFQDDERAALEAFCRKARVPSKGAASPFNHFLEPSPDQLLRVAVALAFKRARLQYVYSILRGKDLATGEFSVERREAQFEVLKAAQTKVLNVQHWHDFLATIRLSGYTGGRFVSSNNNLIFAYVLYLMGRTEYQVPEHKLRPVVAQWFFMTSLTGRFTGSPESAMDFDLADLRRVQTGPEFLAVLRRKCDAVLTSDFWDIALPNELATSSPRSPSLFAYYASLVLLDAEALFSRQKVSALLDPSVHGTRSAAERHHLFPKDHLKKLGITGIRETNQIANYALLEWGDNSEVSSQAPGDYVPALAERFSSGELVEMYHAHALPDGWEHLRYESFLERRRELMAAVIRDAYLKLKATADGLVSADDARLPVQLLVSDGETTQVEFKSTLRKNLHTGEMDLKIEMTALKTITGFLNAHGGTLVLGVADDGDPLGLEPDGFPSEDKMHLHLINILKDRVGGPHMMYIHPRFEDFDGSRVLRVECTKARSPAFLKDGNEERFYVRTGAATTELRGAEAQEYIRQRF